MGRLTALTLMFLLLIGCSWHNIDWDGTEGKNFQQDDKECVADAEKSLPITTFEDFMCIINYPSKFPTVFFIGDIPLFMDVREPMCPQYEKLRKMYIRCMYSKGYYSQDKGVMP